MVNIQVYPDAAQQAQAAAHLFIQSAEAAIRERGHFHAVLSGGGTPRAVYAALTSQYATWAGWASVSIYWGDERCVPPDDPASNYRMAYEALLAHVPVLHQQVYRIYGDKRPDEAAGDYETALRGVFEKRDFPDFDFIFLGLGDDGHTASLFPHTPALYEQRRWVVANHAPVAPHERVTLTASAINAAGLIVFLVTGQNKAERLRQVLRGEGDVNQLPARLIAPANGYLMWLADAAAASLLS
jgi:6-phosphogluconolactonase